MNLYMDGIVVDKYKDLFFDSVYTLISEIKENLKVKPDLVLLHRLFHNLKGQVLFMNFIKTGELCLKAEKIMEATLEKNDFFNNETKREVESLLEKIILDLKDYEDTYSR